MVNFEVILSLPEEMHGYLINKSILNIINNIFFIQLLNLYFPGYQNNLTCCTLIYFKTVLRPKMF